MDLSILSSEATLTHLESGTQLALRFPGLFYTRFLLDNLLIDLISHLNLFLQDLDGVPALMNPII